MPNAKWYAENYSPGDEVLLILEGVITNIDPSDDDCALELDKSWVDTLDKTTTPILGPEGYELVEVQAVEEPQYEGELVLCVSGCAGTYWLGDNDPVCPYAWPEGISYDD